MTHGPSYDELTEAQLDGHACIGCGREDGSMEVFGVGPRGQLFAHELCMQRIMSEADRDGA